MPKSSDTIAAPATRTTPPRSLWLLGPALVMPEIPGKPWWTVALAGAFALGAIVVTGTSRPRAPLQPVHGRHGRGRAGQHAQPASMAHASIIV